MKIQFDEKTRRTWPNPEPSERARITRKYVLRQFWQTFVDDRFDLENAKQTKTVCSYAMEVMDKLESWEEESWVGSRFAACMWIYTKAVLCNGQENMQEYKLLKFRSIMEAVNWVCDDALEDRVWVHELTLSCQEAKVLEPLDYDIEVPCLVQWGMLWSSPTSLNRSFFNSGTIVEKYNEVIDLAIEATFTLSFGEMHTPRICFLISMHTVLCRSPERDWDVNREMGVGDCVSVLFFCLMTETVKTTFPMNENEKIYMSEEDGTAVCSHMILGVRWSPELPVKAPQNAGLERASCPSLGHNSWPEAAYSNAPKLATPRQPPQQCAGITFASNTCRDQREHVPTNSLLETKLKPRCSTTATPKCPKLEQRTETTCRGAFPPRLNLSALSAAKLDSAFCTSWHEIFNSLATSSRMRGSMKVARTTSTTVSS